MENWKTWAGLAIIGYGGMRLFAAQQQQSGLHPKTDDEVPLSAISGNRSTETSVSTGNSLGYWRDDTKVVWSGNDIYGIPAYDILEPDGSLRRIWGNQWFQNY